MRTYRTKVTVVTAFSLLGLSINHKEAIAANSFIDRYGSFAPDINLVDFMPKSELAKQIANPHNENLNTSEQGKIKREALIAKIDALGSAEPLKEQIEKEYNSFDNEANDSSSNLEKTEQSSDLTGIANADRINQNIEDRYDGLVETDSQKIDLFKANQLSKVPTNNFIKSILSKSSDTSTDPQDSLPKYLTAGIYLAIFGGGCLVLVLVLNAFSSSKNQVFFGFLGNIYGKEKVPDSAITLHNRTLKQITNFAKKAEKIDDEKFGNQEFMLYVKLKKQVDKGTQEYQQICQSIKYLEVAIAAQGSYLRIEQTELRYRSRKQQAFYQFVTDNITDDVDKSAFQDRVKRKLAEVIPLVNSQEGREALQTYTTEINKVSQHDLGLKLLSLFKKYQLEDFTILRKVSDLVEQVNAQDLLEDKNLMVLILENYDVLEKLAPILQIAEKDIQPEFFAKILQYMGLVRRHEKAFQKFQELIKVLQQWQKPFNSLKIIREQYPSSEYKLPKEFSEKIPGLNIYKKYEKYLNSDK
ncbi:conserved hypothetical protein [Hyella patelloides LEGE 07179]|uniref:Uncharacterized protein n=1 Tax=Hyella patelloides LEGE 07179 TaxID=945734 RepID=A0A563W197_9CYAN|nr:hypothetical protein [Hyella patelloides]VEP17405.1 conserved hypothetical protein [Hyella patelloides LEGE 07179]